MPSRLVAVAFDARKPAIVARFWAELLGREMVDETGGALLPGGDTQVGLRFVQASTTRTGPNRLHLHVTSDDPPGRQAVVEKALDLGGRHLDVGQRPEERHVVLSDPGGNELCVIEPGNGYLAGCGRLGEVGCEGTRSVGLFWQRALGWPLVWDQDGETAIQSPAGGTKIAWGGPPVAPRHGRNRQWFDLAATDLDAEVSRLAGLGATRLDDVAAGVEMADPDGNEFRVSAR